MKCQHPVKCEVAQQSQRSILLEPSTALTHQAFSTDPAQTQQSCSAPEVCWRSQQLEFIYSTGCWGIPVCLCLSCKLHSVPCFTSAWQHTAWTETHQSQRRTSSVNKDQNLYLKARKRKITGWGVGKEMAACTEMIFCMWPKSVLSAISAYCWVCIHSFKKFLPHWITLYFCSVTAGLWLFLNSSCLQHCYNQVLGKLMFRIRQRSARNWQNVWLNIKTVV